MEHNVYFDGNVQSLGFNSDQGEATVGVCKSGTYTFPTDCVEHITILSGAGRVKFPEQEWHDFKKGDFLIIPANAEVTWEINPGSDACYLCYFR